MKLPAEDRQQDRTAAPAISSPCSRWLMVAMLILVPALAGAGQLLCLEPQESHVTFALKATMHTAEGRIPLRTGEIRFDADTGEASGEIVLDARGADTGSENRDRKMHDEVLESTRYAEIIFRPRHVEVGSEGSQVTLNGLVAIHGDEHPFSFTVKVAVEGERVRATGSFAIPYVAWGLEDPSTFVFRVAKEVTVTIDAVGTLTSGE